MKNFIKCAFLAGIIGLSVTACSGDHAQNHSDSLKADTSVKAGSSKKTGATPGANGSAISSDTGLDKSGSGGTDTTKKK